MDKNRGKPAAVFGGNRRLRMIAVAGKCAAALAFIGGRRAADVLIRRLIVRAAGVYYLEGEWLDDISEIQKHIGGMPVAALPKEQAGRGGRVLVIKPKGAEKQKKRHREIKPSDYLLIAEIIKSPDGATDAPSSNPESRARRRIYKRIAGRNWMVVMDEQKDGRNVMVSFYRPTDSQVRDIFGETN